MTRERGITISLFLAWVVALVASLAVLFIGEVLGQTPCVLCWFQRAFMFPLAIILGIAFCLSDTGVWRYSMPLAAIGGLIAAYHTLLYFGVFPEAIQPCTADGSSCTDAGMVVLGLPIPLLALLAFGTIFALLLQFKRGIQHEP